MLTRPEEQLSFPVTATLICWGSRLGTHRWNCCKWKERKYHIFSKNKILLLVSTSLPRFLMDIFSGEATLSSCFASFLKKKVYSKRKEFAPPFQKGFGTQESKQEVTEVLSFIDNSGKSVCVHVRACVCVCSHGHSIRSKSSMFAIQPLLLRHQASQWTFANFKRSMFTN